MKQICVFLTLMIWINAFSLYAQDEMKLQEKGDKAENRQKYYSQVLADALYMQLKADSLGRIARDKRILSKEIPDDTMKKELAEEILFYEQEAKACQLKADQLFARARQIKENQDLFSDGIDSVLLLYKIVNDIKVYQYRSEATTGFTPNPDSLDRITYEDVHAINAETVSNDQGSDRTDEFIMLSKTPYSKDNPFPAGIALIPGLSYRIQMGVFSSPVPYDAFDGISPIYVEQVQGKDILKYFAGLFYSLVSVTNALERVRGIGFPDAFIVAFLDGNQISTEKAREIEYVKYKL